MSTQFSVLNWNSFSQGDPEEILPDKTCFPCFKWTNFRWSELGEGEEKNRDQSKLILFLFYYYTHTHTHILKGWSPVRKKTPCMFISEQSDSVVAAAGAKCQCSKEVEGVNISIQPMNSVFRCDIFKYSVEQEGVTWKYCQVHNWIFSGTQGGTVRLRHFALRWLKPHHTVIDTYCLLLPFKVPAADHDSGCSAT